MYPADPSSCVGEYRKRYFACRAGWYAAVSSSRCIMSRINRGSELTPEGDEEPPEAGPPPPQSNLLPAPSVGPSARSEFMADEYVQFLEHEFDDRLTVPIWRPSIVELGSVGYVRWGRFIKLFDADHPPEHLPGPPKLCMGEFGAPETVTTKIDSRGVIQWGWESVVGLDTVNKVLSWVNTKGHTSE
jgi:hypothetical protein